MEAKLQVFLFSPPLYHHITGRNGSGKLRTIFTDIRPITWMLTQPDDGRSSLSPEARNHGSQRGWKQRKKEKKKKGKDDESHYRLPGRLEQMWPRCFRTCAPNRARCYAAQLGDDADAI